MTKGENVIRVVLYLVYQPSSNLHGHDFELDTLNPYVAIPYQNLIACSLKKWLKMLGLISSWSVDTVSN